MSGGFRFLDDTDAQRQLGVDRLTFAELLRSGRLKPVSRTGSLQFFRATDIARLRAELHPESEEDDAAELAAPSAIPALKGQGTDDETDLAFKDQGTGAPPAKPARRQHDPAMRVHLRLAADLKWYDINDADIQAWFDQTIPEAYDRYRANAQFIAQRMQHIIALIDAGAARLRANEGATPPETEAG